ncbi:MAG: tetratricopeptide repeat protein [Candidatus Brocadiaceae bacterium]|nr:tetratricopeptide repeat protein [Candidatus Brocadiaceae bacterium]
MKHHCIILFCFVLIGILTSCSKGDIPYTNTGVIYTDDGAYTENSTATKNTEIPNQQQVNDKLEALNNKELFQLALSCGNQGNYSEALTVFNKILETDKNYPNLYYYQGIFYRNMNLTDEAICAFQTAISQNTNSAETHYNLGFAYEHKGLHHDAITEYQKALELVPENRAKQRAAIHLNTGISYYSEGSIDDAINEYKKALKYTPENNKIHQKLGIAYRAKGWENLAKEEFSVYQEQHTKNNP